MEKKRELHYVNARKAEKYMVYGLKKLQKTGNIHGHFQLKSHRQKREGYDNTKIIGNIYPDTKYPGCPYCKARTFVICSCGKLNCNNSKNKEEFKCQWCGKTGRLVDYEGEGFQSGSDL